MVRFVILNIWAVLKLSSFEVISSAVSGNPQPFYHQDLPNKFFSIAHHFKPDIPLLSFYKQSP